MGIPMRRVFSNAAYSLMDSITCEEIVGPKYRWSPAALHDRECIGFVEFIPLHMYGNALWRLVHRVRFLQYSGAMRYPRFGY